MGDTQQATVAKNIIGTKDNRKYSLSIDDYIYHKFMNMKAASCCCGVVSSSQSSTKPDLFILDWNIGTCSGLVLAANKIRDLLILGLLKSRLWVH